MNAEWSETNIIKPETNIKVLDLSDYVALCVSFTKGFMINH